MAQLSTFARKTNTKLVNCLSRRCKMVSVAVTVQQVARPAPAKEIASCSGRQTYHDDMAKILYTEAAISQRVAELGRQIAQDYQGKAPLVLGVLKGSFMFFGDLVRAIEPCPRGLTLDFIRASSYGSGTESTGEVKLKTDLKREKVEGRHVLLVEDIVDTALTITTVNRYLLEECGAASVATATLLDKHERRKLAYRPEYVGFVCPNEFVVGYGLDFDEEYRTIPYIGVLKPECYSHLGIKAPEPDCSGESGGE
ncbi:hypothetical protein Vafri_15490 [Volvox africanus]|uniref:Hypoxanthine phosphoribosyltransferase n=1 Tax=Volvox africanus TaxID=51714 RepID=A0A8J4F818_9CHLO|nr:hypothetical protein Vafri_15490 [Volvox africanus]